MGRRRGECKSPQASLLWGFFGRVGYVSQSEVSSLLRGLPSSLKGGWAGAVWWAAWGQCWDIWDQSFFEPRFCWSSCHFLWHQHLLLVQNGETDTLLVGFYFSLVQFRSIFKCATFWICDLVTKCIFLEQRGCSVAGRGWSYIFAPAFVGKGSGISRASLGKLYTWLLQQSSWNLLRFCTKAAFPTSLFSGHRHWWMRRLTGKKEPSFLVGDSPCLLCQAP